MIILVQPCRTPEVGQVELILSPDPQVDESDQRLWKIFAAVPQRLSEVTVGAIPSGFEEIVRLAGPLPEDEVVAVIINGDDDAAFLMTDFRSVELQEEQVWYYNKNVSSDAFNRATSC